MAKKKQLYWEDVKVGDEVTHLEKICTRPMLVKWAGASGDFNPLHYDYFFAKAQGQPDVVATGGCKRAWLIQLMTDWIGDEGWLSKFSCKFREPDFPRQTRTPGQIVYLGESPKGETWLCKGKVTKKYVEGDEHYVNCDIWIENGKGVVTTPGNATVILPSKR
jgi:hypothetical protein